MALRREIELDERWNTMVKCIRKLEMIMEGVTEERISSQEYMSTFTAIYNMHTDETCATLYPGQQLQGLLYHNYKKSFVDYINSKVLPSLRNKHGEFLLRELVTRWTNHKIMVKLLSHFFNPLRLHLDRFSQPSLKQAGWACFHHLVYQKFRSKAADVIIALIGQERDGLLIDRALLKNAVDVFVEIEIDEGWMDCYESDFERAMLDDTDAYYSRKASEWIVQDSCTVYLLKAEECLKKEKDRVSHYLYWCSETKLMERVQNQLLVVPFKQLLENENSGCQALIKEDKVEDLSRMYKLFHQIPQGLDHIADVLMKNIVCEGMLLMKKTEDAAIKKKAVGPQELELVTKLIKLQDKYLGYADCCFLNNPRIHLALSKAFVAFCNKDVGGTSIAEILALYWDDMLKKGRAGKLDDEAINETVDKLVNLLAYINDKDVFAEFYRKKLSRRLLFEKGVIELEKTVLTKLKQQCGGYFTSKMERMVTDMTLAKENQNKFKEYVDCIHGANLGMEFNVTVITAGRWPTYESSDLNLPAEMANCVEAFKDFYKSVTNHRRLTWIYSLGTCNINAKFEHKTIELIVSTYQAAVLLLFNNADKMSYSEIKAQSNLGDEDLIRLLHSLSCAKYKILNKVPDTKSVSADDYFEFNSKFKDKMRRIKIGVAPVDERKKVVEVVDKDRRYNIDAVLVRIMKSRKVLGNQELIRECVEQLRHQFKADVKQINKRIEDLIARDYMEREKENPNMFRYLA